MKLASKGSMNIMRPCVACMSPKLKNDMIQLPCSHVMCRTCACKRSPEEDGAAPPCPHGCSDDQTINLSYAAQPDIVPTTSPLHVSRISSSSPPIYDNPDNYSDDPPLPAPPDFSDVPPLPPPRPQLRPPHLPLGSTASSTSDSQDEVSTSPINAAAVAYSEPRATRSAPPPPATKPKPSSPAGKKENSKYSGAGNIPTHQVHAARQFSYNDVMFEQDANQPRPALYADAEDQDAVSVAPTGTQRPQAQARSNNNQQQPASISSKSKVSSQMSALQDAIKGVAARPALPKLSEQQPKPVALKLNLKAAAENNQNMSTYTEQGSAAKGRPTRQIESDSSTEEMQASTVAARRPGQVVAKSQSNITDIAKQPARVPVIKRMPSPESLSYEEVFTISSARKCDTCKPNAKPAAAVSSFCHSCKTALCTACTTIHNAKEVFRDHRVEQIKIVNSDESASTESPSPTILCDQHRGEVIKFYCDTCPAVLCTKCVMGHTHQEMPLSAALSLCARRREHMLARVESQTAELDERLSRLCQKQQRADEHYRMTLQAVMTKAADVHKLVDQWRTDKAQMLDEQYGRTIANLLQASEDVEQYVARLKKLREALRIEDRQNPAGIVKATVDLETLGEAPSEPNLALQQFLPNDISTCDFEECVMGKFVVQRRV